MSATDPAPPFPHASRYLLPLRRPATVFSYQWAQGRRPPGPGALALPLLTAAAVLVGGAQLRSVCRAVLARHGALTLTELHRWLHLHGYGIAHHHPVKRLSDALRYEPRCGSVVRVQRGTYQLHPTWRPRRGRNGHAPLLGRPWDEVLLPPDVGNDRAGSLEPSVEAMTPGGPHALQQDQGPHA